MSLDGLRRCAECDLMKELGRSDCESTGVVDGLDISGPVSTYTIQTTAKT